MRQSHYSTITCILLLPTVHHCRTPYRTMSISGKTITDPELPTCIRCRSSPARRCTGCLGAPSYDEETLMPSFYCSVDCQKADWHWHRTECRKLQARKSLNRAALLLQAIIYKIRKHTTTLRITSVHVESTTIHLNGTQPGPSFTQQMKPFPVHLFEDRAILESALAYMACMEAMVFLYRVTIDLLGGQIA
jgi:hypothetical protein